MVDLVQPERPTIHHGRAALTVEMVAGHSAVTSAISATPMKLLVPQSRGPSVWAFSSSFGGGLVVGDQTELHLTLGPGTRTMVGTQASTKIYRNPSSQPCTHQTRAVVGEEALLVFAPDPVQAFAESRYQQRQIFYLAEGAGLVLVDWFTSGRAARGERWKFHLLQNRNEVFVNGRRAFLDSILLGEKAGIPLGEHQVGRFNCFATLCVIGQPLEAFASGMLAALGTHPVERKARLILAASAVTGGAVVRFAGESVEEVGHELHRQLGFVASLLGDDPWARKW